MSLLYRGEIVFGEKIYRLDAHGFLNPPGQWDEGFANGMAEMLGIYRGLTDKHWEMINYLRKKFLEEKTVPPVVVACADNKLRLNIFKDLFPTGYHRGACRIAGINFDFMMDTNYWLTYETSNVSRRPGFEQAVTATGFLEDFDAWDERFAEAVIHEWKLPGGLTDRHRKIIAYLRDYYRKTKNIPTVFEMCVDNNLNLEELQELFPGGYRRGACRIAGLPFFP